MIFFFFFFFFSSRRRHTRFKCDWSSDVCSSDLTRRVPRWSSPRREGGARLPSGIAGRQRLGGRIGYYRLRAPVLLLVRGHDGDRIARRKTGVERLIELALNLLPIAALARLIGRGVAHLNLARPGLPGQMGSLPRMVPAPSSGRQPWRSRLLLCR